MTANKLPTDSTLLLSDEDVRAAFDWDIAIRSLRAAYGGNVSDDMFPPRSMARGDGLWLRGLSGIAPDGGVMGVKLIAASMTAGAACYLVPLFDQETTALVALLDGNSITGFRTAATSAMAADRLAPPGASRVAVIGSGFEARNHLRALAVLRPLTEVTVYSPSATSRATFVADVADAHPDVVAVDSAQEAVAHADIVVCAARSRDESPTFLGAWLRPGMTVISIGSTLPEQRELDTDAIARADLIIADMVTEVAHDTGDMIAAARDGVSFADGLVALSDVIGGHHPGRTDLEQIVIYKSVGAAIQDITVSAMCANRAVELGIGTRLPALIRPVRKGK
ncbi:ornithine cyclodeaminase family protein [Sphingomonas sp. PB4P5]|uniref:ornithine cyclodeaminase family protein n=1 Tax=Parasphingomonas puruogangriensis TaxID=3096155 RepID=UPI002FC69267